MNNPPADIQLRKNFSLQDDDKEVILFNSSLPNFKNSQNE